MPVQTASTLSFMLVLIYPADHRRAAMKEARTGGGVPPSIALEYCAPVEAQTSPSQSHATSETSPGGS